MKIAICGSLDHYREMDHVRKKLETAGHIVLFPASADKLIKGIIDEKYITTSKNSTTLQSREKKNQAIIVHMEKIRQSDAVLIINLPKKGIENYIGGNTFLEMGFALAFGKKIYLYNPVPEVAYKDEISGMLPVIINQDLSMLK